MQFTPFLAFLSQTDNKTTVEMEGLRKGVVKESGRPLLHLDVFTVLLRLILFWKKLRY